MRIISSRAWMGKRVEDPIRPTSIDHEVDEITDEGGKLEERYNWIDYHFEQDGGYCRARTYMDTIDEVAIYGPFAGRDDLRPVDAPKLRDAVLAYLQRRFNRITELSANGYTMVWKRPRS